MQQKKSCQKIIYDELVKKTNDIQTIDTSNLVKKMTLTQELIKFFKKMLDFCHNNKYITTQLFNRLVSEVLLQD